jgi:serine phosphatase RsbU (regulator of sigma subunit)/tetratricopeptide (TPR) repeat protein
MSVQTINTATTVSIDKLNADAWLLNRKEPLKAIELAKQALAKSEAEKYLKGIADANRILGASNIWISKNEEALNYSFTAITAFKDIGDKINEAQTNYNIATNFYYLSDYDTALRYYTTSLDLYTAANHEPGMADALNGLGAVYYTIEQNEKAIELLLNSKQLCEKHKATDVLVKVLDGLGDAYYNKQDYFLAQKYYEHGIKITSANNDFKQVEAFCLDGLGRTLAALKEYQPAKLNYEKSLSIRRTIGFKVGEALTLTNIGKLFFDKGDTPQALQYFEESYKISQTISSKEGIYQSSEQLALLYEKTNKFDLSLKYYKIFHSAKEEVRNQKSSQLQKSMELQNKMLQSQAEKLVLEEKAKELQNFSDNLVLLSQIGQQIISHLHVQDIVDTVYAHVNNLMDATGFGIGIFLPDKNQIVYPLYIEDNERFENIIYDLTDINRLTNVCFLNKQEIVINNFKNEIHNYVKDYKPPLAGKQVTSTIYLPLLISNNAIGVITVQSFSTNAYKDYHLNVLRNMAAYTAIALEKAALYQEQEKIVADRTRELIVKNEEIGKAYQNNKLLSEIGLKITATLNFDEIFNMLHFYVDQLMDSACFGVRIYHPDKNAVEYKFEIENGVRDFIPVLIPMDNDNNYSVWCIKNKKEIFINDNINEHKKYVKEINVVAGDMPHSLIFYPIMAGEKVLGVITIQSFNKYAYTEYHLDILKTLATYMSIALENANMYERLEEKVKERTAEVIEQKVIIEERNKDITDSIKYAKKIQQAIIPPSDLLKNSFPESFIYYKPKDIVSGDFYWFQNFNDEVFVFAVADCTGHGVPGAFMSLICNNLMNQIIGDEKITSPGKALTILDKKLHSLLNKSADRTSNDGMDIALCAYNLKTGTLQFSGAHRPLLIVSNGVMKEIKPSKHSIGGYFDNDKTFVDHDISLQKGDTIYVLTDGYTDQFGGPKGKKFKFKQLQSILIANANKPLNEQCDVLNQAIENWKGNLEQVDDICVIGIRV